MSKANLQLVDKDSGVDKQKALETALANIDRAFGKGSVMRLGEQKAMDIESIPTGSLGLDIALGIGGLPKGRVIEIYGPESSGKTTLSLHIVAEAQKNGGVCAFVDAEHALDPLYAKKLGVDLDELLISQPDTGEQALEITDTLVRSGAVNMVIVDDDIALPDLPQPRGVAGTLFVHKIAGAMAEAGKPLEEIVAAARRIIGNVASIGKSLDTCTIPGSPKESRIPSGKAELGLGIHGQETARHVALVTLFVEIFL
mgnify:CR=1 FL=1